MKNNKDLHKILKSFLDKNDHLYIIYSTDDIEQKFPNIKKVQTYINELLENGYLEIVKNYDDTSSYKIKNYAITSKGQSAVFNETLLEEKKKQSSERLSKTIQLILWILGAIISVITIGTLIMNSTKKL